MGCWDIFCILCGNTCHGILEGDNIFKNKKEMEFYSHITRSFVKQTKWLDKLTFLTLNNKIYHNCEETACNINITNGKKNFTQIGMYDLGSFEDVLSHEVDNYGTFVHTDCWKFVKSTLKIDLVYGDLPIDKTKFNKTGLYKLVDISYGKIESYWDQDFYFDKVCEDSNEYMCMSPLKNSQNAARIKKIIKLLKIRPGRQSPSVSATAFGKGTIKIGSDCNFWIQSKNKWVKMTGTVVKKTVTFNRKDKKYHKAIKKLPQIGEFNTKPYFIESFQIDKNNVKLTIIALEE